MSDNIMHIAHPPAGTRLRVVMDTDIANEIDDHFAVCEMLASPERFNVQAVIAAPYLHHKVKSHREGMEKSYDELHKVFGLLNRDDSNIIFKGSAHPMTESGKPVFSPGAEKIVELAFDAARAGERLFVIGIAAATDIASALLMAPEIAGNLTICWLGGHPAGPWQNNEFNLAQDFQAAQVIFDSGAAIIQFPCRNVAQMLSLSRYELEARYHGSGILDYLRERTIAEMDLCSNTTRPIWDVAPVAWLLDDQPFISEVLKTPHLELDGRETPRENAPFFRRIASLRRDQIMEQLISILKKA